MAQYTVEYRETAGGNALQSDPITARDDVEAGYEAKKAFIVVQANLGARIYRVLDQSGGVVATHEGT